MEKLDATLNTRDPLLLKNFLMGILKYGTFQGAEYKIQNNTSKYFNRISVTEC